ncbi:MAG: hypothetical protein IJK04_14660, partial [Kiritimatiellae bacterium]|nr:hypothetical protein [Kiritimatiellia bacterium]
MKNTNTSTSSSRGLVARAPALLALVCALAVPTASFARTVSVAAIKDGLATAAFGDADGAAYTLAWGYGAADGGDATNGWAHFETLGAVAADATSRSVALPAGWGDTATHLRFFLLGPNLPAGATRVEYLQSAQTKDSPTQWIDTDVVGKAGVEAEVDFMWTAGSDSTILGSRKDSGDTRFLALHWNGSKIGSSFTTWASFSTLSATASSETRYLARASLADGAQSLSIDGTTKATSAISSSLDTGLDMYLFAANLYGSAKQGVSAKIYSAKIWLDGELKRNFVPCRDAGNVPAMYDFVSGHYFHNGGSGSFTCGDPVGDPIAATSATASTADYGAPDAYLDYVEATGTQSVLLEGCTIGPDYRLVAEYAYPDPIVRKNNCLFGVYKYGMTAGFYYNNSETAPLNFWSGTGGVNGSGGSNQSTQTEVPATPGERQTVVMNLGAGESSIYAADGRKVWSGTLKGSVTADSTSAISLFTASRLSGYNSNAKIYSFRIYDATGALAHHFLPCLKGSVAGLYDKATGRIHYPQGGDLGAGPELPRPAELVEWVQSDGASGNRQLYIDTEVPAKAGVGMTAEMEWATKPAGNGVDNIFCGAGDANAHIWLYDAVADAGNAAATHRFGYYTWKLQLQSNSVVRAGTRYHVEAHQAHGD